MKLLRDDCDMWVRTCLIGLAVDWTEAEAKLGGVRLLARALGFGSWLVELVGLVRGACCSSQRENN